MVQSVEAPIPASSNLNGVPSSAQYEALQTVMRDLYTKVILLAQDHVFKINEQSQTADQLVSSHF